MPQIEKSNEFRSGEWEKRAFLLRNLSIINSGSLGIKKKEFEHFGPQISDQHKGQSRYLHTMVRLKDIASLLMFKNNCI